MSITPGEPSYPERSRKADTAGDSPEDCSAGSRLRLVHGGRETLRRAERFIPAVLGVETDRVSRPLMLDAATRVRHLYVTGMPGAGKSTVLLNLALHDLATGNGCCLLDNHGGLVNDFLTRAGATRGQLDRIVVVDAADTARPVGINLLNARSEYEQDLVVQFFLGVFSRMYLAEHQGPMFHQIVRNGLLLLMGAGRTLAEFPLVLTDRTYLDRLLAGSVDPFVKRFFERIWKQAGDLSKSDYLSYFTSKFSAFFDDRLMRNMLAQQAGLDLDAALAEGKVVLVNLARGRIGDYNATLLGHIILHLIRRSAMRRDSASSPPLFNLYVDEAHEFAGGELRELLTAMRKFGVGVALANQNIEDFDPALQATILGSVGTFVVLRQGVSASQTLEPFTQPRFDRRDLMRLPDYTAVVRAGAGKSFAMPQRLHLCPPPRYRDLASATAVREASAARYGRPRAEVEAELLRVVGEDEEWIQEALKMIQFSKRLKKVGSAAESADGEGD